MIISYLVVELFSKIHFRAVVVAPYTIERTLKNISLPPRTILAGNFNAHHMWWNSRARRSLRHEALIQILEEGDYDLISVCNGAGRGTNLMPRPVPREAGPRTENGVGSSMIGPVRGTETGPRFDLRGPGQGTVQGPISLAPGGALQRGPI